MSMVALYKLTCCNRFMAFGRVIISPEAKFPQVVCPICKKQVDLSPKDAYYADEKKANIPHVHQYVLPEREEETDVLF